MSQNRPKRGSCLGTTLKWIMIVFALYVLMHWMTAGQDEIIEGPPEAPEGSTVQ